MTFSFINNKWFFLSFVRCRRLIFWLCPCLCIFLLIRDFFVCMKFSDLSRKVLKVMYKVNYSVLILIIWVNVAYKVSILHDCLNLPLGQIKLIIIIRIHARYESRTVNTFKLIYFYSADCHEKVCTCEDLQTPDIYLCVCCMLDQSIFFSWQ